MNIVQKKVQIPKCTESSLVLVATGDSRIEVSGSAVVGGDTWTLDEPRQWDFSEVSAPFLVFGHLALKEGTCDLELLIEVRDGVSETDKTGYRILWTVFQMLSAKDQEGPGTLTFFQPTPEEAPNRKSPPEEVPE